MGYTWPWHLGHYYTDSPARGSKRPPCLAMGNGSPWIGIKFELKPSSCACLRNRGWAYIAGESVFNCRCSCGIGIARTYNPPEVVVYTYVCVCVIRAHSIYAAPLTDNDARAWPSSSCERRAQDARLWRGLALCVCVCVCLHHHLQKRTNIYIICLE